MFTSDPQILPPPSTVINDMATLTVDKLPVVFAGLIKDMTLNIQEFPDDVTVENLGLDSPYELLAYYQTKTLTLYRRPILDLWCESERPLAVLVREVIISELGQSLSLSDEDIEALVA